MGAIMTLLALPPQNAASVVVEAVSDQQLLTLGTETAATEFGVLDRDTLPTRVAAELEDLVSDVRDDLIDPRVVADDPAQAPQIVLRRIRERLRQSGRSLLAGTATRPGPHGEEAVLVIALPTGVVRRAEVACSLEAS